MSSPFYQPESPNHFSSSEMNSFFSPTYHASFERYDGPSTPVEDEDDLFDEFEEFAALLAERSAIQKIEKDNWKQKKKECEFKINNSRGYYLEEFFESNLFSENIPIDLNPLEDQSEMYSEIKHNKTVEDYENFQLFSLFSAAREDVDDEYKTSNLTFDDKVLDDFKSGFKNEDLNLEIRREKVDKKLFIERNLFQAIQYHNKIDKNYISDHFPMEDNFDKINVNLFHSVDNLIHVKNRIQEIAERDNRFKNLFLKDRHFQKFRNLILKDKYIDRFCVIMYLLFVEPDLLINDRDKKLNEVNSFIFKNSRYKFFLISDIFKSVNIFFFEDFCNFRIYKCFIANSLLNNFRNYVEIEKKSSSKKIRIDDQFNEDDDIGNLVLNDVRIHLMDRFYYPDREDDIEEDKHKNSKKFTHEIIDVDYAYLREKEIRHDIIKF